MRDIRPNPISRRRRTLPDVPQETFSPEDKPKKRLAGSSVPVTSVHLSRQHIRTQKPTSATLKKSTPLKEEHSFNPSKEFAEAGGKKRPLFAKPEAKKQSRPLMRVGHKERLVLAVLFALIIVAAGIAAVIFLPKADITLAIQTAPLLVDQRLTIRSANTNEADVIPGSAFSREVSVNATVPVTSKEVVGAKATGTVEIVNRTTEEQKIRERSRLVTKDGELFYMQKYVVVPAASSGTPTRASVTVEADKAGTAGNIIPQRLDFAALDASSQPLLYAENTATFSGGFGEEVAIVKESDIEAAKKSAQDIAKSQAEQEIRSQLPKGWTILEESWTGEVKDFSTEAALNSQQASISFAATVNIKVLGYEDDKFQKSLSDVLQSKLDQDYMLFPGPISFTKSVEAIDWEKGEGTLNVRVTHKTIPNFSVDSLKEKLSGLTESEASQYVKGLHGVQSATIELWPFWVHSIPSIDKRITVTIKSEH